MISKISLSLLVIAISHLGCSHGEDSKAKGDCSGIIGFSSSGVSKVYSTGLIQYKTNIFDSAHGWNRDTGTFTVKCPGVYSVSFAAYGNGDARFTLRKRTTGNQFISIISTPPGGGANSVLVKLGRAEQLSMTTPASMRTGLEDDAPVNSFTVYRVSE